MQIINTYREVFVSHLNQYYQIGEPKNLYAPVDYILKLGGKRLRPVLVLMTADLFDADYNKALDASLAIEVFHNFTLLHDDVMDEAPLRRGKDTVHIKWNLNTAILSGDAMLIMAYKLLEPYDGEIFILLTKLLSKTALEVCEGQQYDMDFETRNDVTIDEYIKMITLKTAVLVGAAMKMGAIVAKTSIENQNAIYEFGKNLGIAFQLQDDYLDTFGNSATFGKQIGGDIMENKKTFLYLKAVEKLEGDAKKELFELYNTETDNINGKIERVKFLLTQSGSEEDTKNAIKQYTNLAFEALNGIDLSEKKRQLLITFGNELMNRKV